MRKAKFLITLLLLFMPLYFINAADYAGEPSYSEVIEQKKEVLLSVTKGGNNSLKLSWNELEGSKQYLVYRSTKKTSGFKRIKTLTTNSYTDTKLKYGTTYYYKVVSVVENDKITSEVKSKKVIPNTVTNVKAQAGNKQVKITFSKTSNSGYEVYRSTDTKKWTKVTTLTKSSKVSYTNKSLSTNKTYYYKVRAYQIVNRKKVYGAYSEIVSALTAPTTPTISVKAAAYDQINVTIKKVSGASYYQVQRSINSKKGFKTIDKTETLLYEDDDINPTTNYYYRVRACNKNKLCGSFSKVYKAKTTIAKPKLKGTANNREANLSWNNIEYADGYVVYYSTNKTKNYKKIGTTSETSIKKTGLTPGKTYYFKVRTYVSEDGKNYYSSYSNILTLKPTIKKVSNVSLTADTTSINIKWNNIPGVTGYQVYRATSKKGTYKKIKTINTSTFNNTKLKQNTSYYYKVRAYITIGKKKYYGSFSSIVGTKTLDEKNIDYTKVMEKAKEIVNKYDIKTRFHLRDELSYTKFSKTEIEYAIKNIDVDWKENAVFYLNDSWTSSSMSENGLRKYLKYFEFTDEEIEYGLSKVNIDFYENAKNSAMDNWYEHSEQSLKKFLIEEEFTEDQVKTAMESIKGIADFNQSAIYILENKVEVYFSSLKEVEDELREKLFTEEQIQNVLKESNKYNFYDIALNRIFEKLGDYNTKSKATEYLTNAKFTSDEVNKTVELLFKEITSTIDKINLNDPIMVNFGGIGNGCGKHVIFKNPQDINKIPSESVDGKSIYQFGDGVEEALNSIELDKEKTNDVVNKINTLKLPKGMNYLEASVRDDGGFSYGGGRLRLAMSSFYGEFGKAFDSLYDENNKVMEELLKDAYFVGGGCGAGPEPPVRLTKELCDEYNLTCDAW